MLLTDKSETGGAHASNCLADFMETSWSSRGNWYGWSWSNDIANSFNDYIPFINIVYQYQTGYKWYGNSDSWTFYKNEIDNNRPVVLLVDSNGDGYTDHFVTGIGYNNTSNTYAIYDTWDRNIHWFSWHAMTNGNPWGIYGYTYFRLKFSVTASADPTGMGSVQGGGYYFTEEQVTVSATANEGYRFVNWTENGTEVSTLANYVFNAGTNRTLIAHFEEEPPVVPETLIIENTVLNSGEEDCFNATLDITVAGGVNQVAFLSGSTATLIAGNSIRFLPGFHAFNGSAVSAYITTNNTFCTPFQPDLFFAPVTEKSSEVVATGNTLFLNDGTDKLKVYPNPCKNRFTVEYKPISGKTNLSIFDLSGKKIQSIEISEPNNKVEISNLNKGIYLIALKNKNGVFTSRVNVIE